jgi:GTP-binding protein
VLSEDPNVERRQGAPVVLGLSSVSGAGIEALKNAIFSHASVAGPGEVEASIDGRDRVAEHAVYRPAERSGYEVKRVGTSSFAVSGPAVERLIARHDLENQEALAFIEDRLRSMGVIKELEAQGFEPGEEITIGEVAFDLYPGQSQG